MVEKPNLIDLTVAHSSSPVHLRDRLSVWSPSSSIPDSHLHLLSTALTSDIELHLFLLQDVFPPVDGAGVGECVSVCRVFQSQAEVHSYPQVFPHHCSISVKPVLFFKVVRAVFKDVHYPVGAVSPLYSYIFMSVTCGYKGQLNRLHPRIHIHLWDCEVRTTNNDLCAQSVKAPMFDM